VVGPLTSFAIAAFCFGATRALPGPPWGAALLGYLVVVNLLVGAFNLVPGFPLDGGRVLRALLWSWRGDLGWATRIASRVGAAVAVLLIVVGALRAVGGEIVGGLWFVLIGVFLHHAAQSTYQLTRLRARLEPLGAGDVMTPRPVTVSPDLPLTAIIDEQFARHRVTGFPVLHDGRLVGFITRRLVEKHAATAAAAHATVADAMVPVGPDHVVSHDDSAWLAFLKTSRNRVGRVGVLDRGRLVGVVTRHDLQHVVAVAQIRAEVGRRAA
jgi:CBS domain-containing protein